MNVCVVPLLENRLKDPSDSNNYRPIAVVTVVSKIFEFIVLKRLSDFLYTLDNKFGWKSGRSTDLWI